ncbi:unnamed protein product [Urochloa decumbens]|uniref:DUF6598 domain-containing protein n=1 Tax=Urochloa decumbens TaxID=240449 RepID=A0ABC9CQG9_9POAL
MVQIRILSQSILGGLRRSNVATSPASVHRLVSTSRHLLSFMGSGTPRWWSSALARRVSPRFAAANRPMRHASQFSHGSRSMASSSGVKGEELGKPDMQPLNPSANDFIISLGGHSAISREDERRARVNIISGDEDACSTTLELMDNKRDTTGANVHIAGCELSSEDEECWAAEVPGCPMDGVYPLDILPYSSHRDGSIYSSTCSWKGDFCIVDRNQTRREAMMFSDPTDCYIINGTCRRHATCHMLQIFSMKLANIPVEHGPVELYGYIAARDNLDRLLNYVINVSRDDPIILEQGSLIDMTGPKRGIQLIDTILIEYDMKVKTGQHEKEDLQVIDGVSLLDDIDTWNCSPFTCRMNGGYGGIDITAARLDSAVEATVEVAISQVQGGFSMCLGCFTSGLHEEIRLFDGAIVKSGGLKRSVVAVVMGAQMDLKFKVAAGSCIPAEHCCSFKATKHGRATQEIKTDLALIAVKVTWSTLD